jgi:hypothetical protein
MAGKYKHWWIAMALALLVPSSAWAGPFFGDWGWCWNPAPDCPRSQYSRWHWWAPTAFYVRMYLHPTSLDEFPPGPSPSVPPTYIIGKSCCITIPSAPTTPYADPTGYYGRPIAPE